MSKGNEFALRQLFYQYHQVIGVFVFRLTHSKELAEEIVQDVFLKLWTNRQSASSIRNLKSWLFTISRNLSLNVLRYQVKEKHVKKYLETLTFDIVDIQEEMVLNDRFTLVKEAVKKLPPQQQKVFLLSRYQRMKYEEIAREMKISKGTVKSYLQIATRSIINFINHHSAQLLLVWFLIFQ